MSLTPTMFSKVGEALYGPCWRIELAGALKVSERTVRRWQNGSTIPEGIGADLAALCRKRSVEIARIANQLDKEGA